MKTGRGRPTASAFSLASLRPLRSSLLALSGAGRWVSSSAAKDRARWALWLPVLLGAGIGIYFSLPSEPALWLAGVAAGLALGAAWVCIANGSITLRVVLAMLAAVALGFSVAKLREEIVAAPVLAERIGPIVFEGRVASAEPHGKGVRVTLGDIRAPALAAAVTPKLVRVSFRAGAEGLVPGERISAMAVFMPPPGPAAPGAFDFSRAAFFDGIGAVGYAYGRPVVIGGPPPPGILDKAVDALSALRWRMTARIHDVLPGSEGSIASAIITGERGGISREDEQELRDAGLAHVLAIAGLHMALVGLGLFWIVRAILALVPALALAYPIKKWAAVAALAGAVFYLVISGAAPPTIRAFTMLSMMLMGILVDRPALSMRSLALAAAVILLVEPESLIEPGFQMSFAAVASLIAIAEWEQARAARGAGLGPVRFAGIRRYVRGVAMTSFVGSLATAPYAIFHFDRATHYAVLGNLLAMPIMGFVVMPAAAISVVLMPFGLDVWPLEAMGWGIEAMLAVGAWVSHLPGAVSQVAAWPVSALVLVSLGGLWCAIWTRPWRWLGLIPAVLGTALGFASPVPDMLIGRDGTTIAIRAGDGTLKLLPVYRDGYSANEWLKRDGDERTATHAIASRADGVTCDAEGCIARLRGGTILAVPLRIDAFDEDCASASIVVSAMAVPQPCRGPKLVIGKADIEASGGYAIRLSETVGVQSVDDARGGRPWNPRPVGVSSRQAK